jgi:hypothetical protein
MRTDIFIYSSQSSPALQREGRQGLEDDLDEFLAGVGETTGGGSGVGGWNIDLALAEGVPVEEWAERLVAFLQEWGVPRDTYFHIIPPDWVQGQKPRRIDVFAEEQDGNESNKQ